MSAEIEESGREIAEAERTKFPPETGWEEFRDFLMASGATGKEADAFIWAAIEREKPVPENYEGKQEDFRQGLALIRASQPPRRDPEERYGKLIQGLEKEVQELKHGAERRKQEIKPKRRKKR